MKLSEKSRQIVEDHGWEDLPNYPITTHHRDLERVAMRVQEETAKRCAEIAKAAKDSWTGTLQHQQERYAASSGIEQAIREEFLWPPDRQDLTMFREEFLEEPPKLTDEEVKTVLSNAEWHGNGLGERRLGDYKMTPLLSILLTEYLALKYPQTGQGL